MNTNINGLKSEVSGKIKVFVVVTLFDFDFHFPFHSDTRSDIRFLSSFVDSSMFGETIG
jgi:hypothetical protein